MGVGDNSSDGVFGKVNSSPDNNYSTLTELTGFSEKLAGSKIIKIQVITDKLLFALLDNGKILSSGSGGITYNYILGRNKSGSADDLVNFVNEFDGSNDDKFIIDIYSHEYWNICYAISRSGKLYSWGLDQKDLLGDGTTGNRYPNLTPILTGVKRRGIDFTDKYINVMTSSGDTMLCLTQDGKIMIWGTSNGNPTTPSSTPIEWAYSNNTKVWKQDFSGNEFINGTLDGTIVSFSKNTKYCSYFGIITSNNSLYLAGSRLTKWYWPISLTYWPTDPLFHKLYIDKKVKYAVFNDPGMYYIDTDNKLYHLGKVYNGNDGSGTSKTDNRILNGFEVNLGDGVTVKTKTDEIISTFNISKSGMNISVPTIISGSLSIDNIVEKTSTTGVTIDGVLLKDNKVRIGNDSNSTTLEASTSGGALNLKLPSSSGSSGQYLKTDGSGNTSWNTIDSIKEGDSSVEVTDSGSNGEIKLKADGDDVISSIT